MLAFVASLRKFSTNFELLYFCLVINWFGIDCSLRVCNMQMLFLIGSHCRFLLKKTCGIFDDIDLYIHVRFVSDICVKWLGFPSDFYGFCSICFVTVDLE